MEPHDGLEMLRRASSLAPSTQVIVMTAYGTIESAVEAMRRGAFDYVAKPFQVPELLIRVEKAVERRRLLSQMSLYAEDFRRLHGLSSIVGQSEIMRRLGQQIARAASSDATVLILGESGTGKELVARALHALSKRSDKPFVAVNCAAMTQTLLDSDVVRHARALHRRHQGRPPRPVREAGRRHAVHSTRSPRHARHRQAPARHP
jgi:two-component system response regulator HydG